jgi:hypothetical protein
MWSAVEPEFRRAVIESRPGTLERLARLYTSLLTPSELVITRDFYASATGRKVIRAKYAEMDLAPVVDEIVANPDGKVSAQALENSEDGMKRKLAQDLTDDDMAALEAFIKALSREKALKVAAAVQSLTLEIMNEEDPELEARIDELMMAAMEQYMKEQDAKR